MINNRAVLLSTLGGSILQIGMVLAGHSSASIAQLFAPGGMGISLIAGFAYAWLARTPSASSAAAGGAIAGAGCALIGIFISFLLGDVSASVLAFGTASSALTGAIGGWVGQMLSARRVKN